LPINTLADLRLAMKPGTVVKVTNHVYPELSGDRTVLKRQTARWCLSLPVDHPRYAETPDGSWLNIPKAKECTFADGAVTIHRDPEFDDPGPWCTIRID